MISNQAKIEGLLFVAGETGITLTQIAHLVGILKPAALEQLASLKEKYASDSSCSFELQHAEECYFLTTKKKLSSVINAYFAGPAITTLSKAALETLAVIAYQQPVTRLQIEEVRGVGCGAMLTKLQNFGLIKEAGRIDAPGRPLVYATTERFLSHFGLEHLTDLPPLPQSDDDNLTTDKQSTDLFSLFSEAIDTNNTKE